MHDVENQPIRVFGNEVRVQRERAGLTQKELAANVYCSPSLISAIENGTRLAKRDVVRHCDEVLDTGGILLRLWPLTTTRAYPSWFAHVAELETKAIKIHEWELRYVPGLLQTPDYARAVMRAFRPRDDDDAIERNVIARMERQCLLTRADPPMAWFIMEESVLHRPFGGSNVMAKQLDHLEQMSETTNIAIQILSSAMTEHPGVEGPLRILEFPDTFPIGYVEGWDMGRVIESRTAVTEVMTCYDMIRASALPRTESINIVRSVRSSLYG